MGREREGRRPNGHVCDHSVIPLGKLWEWGSCTAYASGPSKGDPCQGAKELLSPLGGHPLGVVTAQHHSLSLGQERGSKSPKYVRVKTCTWWPLERCVQQSD